MAKKILKNYISLSIILLDFLFRTGKNYYTEIFSDECKYVFKEKKIPNYIIDNIEILSGSYRENSDEEDSDREN